MKLDYKSNTHISKSPSNLIFGVAVALQESYEVLPVDVFDQDQFHASVVQVREGTKALRGELVPSGDTEQAHL